MYLAIWLCWNDVVFDKIPIYFFIASHIHGYTLDQNIVAIPKGGGELPVKYMRLLETLTMEIFAKHGPRSSNTLSL